MSYLGQSRGWLTSLRVRVGHHVCGRTHSVGRAQPERRARRAACSPWSQGARRAPRIGLPSLLTVCACRPGCRQARCAWPATHRVSSPLYNICKVALSALCPLKSLLPLWGAGGAAPTSQPLLYTCACSCYATLTSQRGDGRPTEQTKRKANAERPKEIGGRLISG